MVALETLRSNSSSTYHFLQGVSWPGCMYCKPTTTLENTMSLSIYTASAPVLIRYLSNLKAILEKAQAFCEQKKIEPSVLLNSRLAPDMYPLTAQIQLASDMAKSCLSRLAETE